MAPTKRIKISMSQAAVAVRIWIVGFSCLAIVAVCYSCTHLMRRNSLSEQLSESFVFVRGQSGQILQCALDPHGEDGSCEALDQNVSLHASYVRPRIPGVSVPDVPFSLDYECFCRQNAYSGQRTFVHRPLGRPTAFAGGYRFEEQLASIVVLLCYGTVSLHMLSCACVVLGWVRKIAVAGGISRDWAWTRKALLEALGCHRAGAQDNDRILEVVKQKRLRRARAILKVIRPLLIFLLLGEAATFHGFGPCMSHSYLYDSSVVPCLCIAMLILPYGFHFRTASPMLLDGMNVLLSAVWVWKYLVLGRIRGTPLSGSLSFIHTEGTGYLFHAPWMLAFRLCQGIACGNAKLSVVLNICITAVDMFSFSNAEPGDPAGYYNQQQIMICLGWTSILWWIEQQSVAEAVALVSSENNYSLARRVLAASCDVTACLDADLSFLEPCPKLAHMLLKHPKSIVEGRSFVDLLCSDDVDNMRSLAQAEVELTTSKPSRQDPARTMHVKLKDAYQKEISVQLFWCCGAHEDGRVKHLVGITEREEMFEHGGGVLPGQAAEDFPHLCPVLEGSAFKFDSADRVCSSCAQLSAVSIQTPGSSAESEDEEEEEEEEEQRRAGNEFSVRIDAATADLTFLSCSRAFARLSGVSDISGIGIGLRRWLLPGKVGQFLAWLQSSDLDSSCKVYLRPPGLCHFLYRSRCHRVAAQMQPCTGTAANAVELVFSSPRPSLCSGGVRRYRHLPLKPDITKLRLDVRIPEVAVVGADLPEDARRLLPGLEAGGLVQTWLVHCDAFADIIKDFAEKVIHGTRQADAALDLGYWRIRTRESDTCLAHFKLTGFVLSTNPPQRVSLSCQLQLRLPRAAEVYAAHGRIGAAGGCEDEARVILGDDDGSDMWILECGAQLAQFLGFPAQGHSFLSWLADPAAFVTWASGIYEFSKGDVVPLAALHFGELVLQPNALTEEGWEIRATCRCDTLPWDLARREAVLSVHLSGLRRVRRLASRGSLCSL